MGPACDASPGKLAFSDDGRQAAGKPMGSNVTDQHRPISQRFKSLDDYLAFLERTEGPVDGAWYRQVRPGVYVLQTGGNLRLEGGNPPKQTFTREELERKFGFTN